MTRKIKIVFHFVAVVIIYVLESHGNQSIDKNYSTAVCIEGCLAQENVSTEH